MRCASPGVAGGIGGVGGPYLFRVCRLKFYFFFLLRSALWLEKAGFFLVMMVLGRAMMMKMMTKILTKEHEYPERQTEVV